MGEQYSHAYFLVIQNPCETLRMLLTDKEGHTVNVTPRPPRIQIQWP